VELVAAFLTAVLALALGFWVWRRMSRLARVSRRLTLYAVAFGALAASVAVYVEGVVLRWTALDFDVLVAGPAGALMATFLLAAPLEEATKVLVIWPLYRTGRVDGPRLGVCYAAGAGAGFAAVEGAWIVLGADAVPLALVRTVLSSLAHVFSAGTWGYALGAGRVRGRWFGLTWFLVVLLHGLFDHIVWGRGPGFLAATVPLLAFMALGASLAFREILPEPSEHPQRIEPPTLTQVQEALRTGEKPVMLRWVVIGAFVTLGLVITSVALSVLIGHRFGFDFAVADEADVRSATPLLLLGTAVLLAFPLAGYLVARASASPSLLEPTLATLLALAALVTVLALTAPIAVLFALAVAPVALGLSCGGAWIGLER
jgi:hypothetical protein